MIMGNVPSQPWLNNLIVFSYNNLSSNMIILIQLTMEAPNFKEEYVQWRKLTTL